MGVTLLPLKNHVVLGLVSTSKFALLKSLSWDWIFKNCFCIFDTNIEDNFIISYESFIKITITVIKVSINPSSLRIEMINMCFAGWGGMEWMFWMKHLQYLSLWCFLCLRVKISQCLCFSVVLQGCYSCSSLTTPLQTCNTPPLL